MLLEQDIKMVWTIHNRSWYENLGYIFTKYGNTFIIPIKDLHQGSTLKIKVQCDSCEEIYDYYYKDYLKKKCKDLCKNCKINIRKLKYNISDVRINNFICYDFCDGMGIYKITNTNNGKFYIGSSVDLYHRKSVHISKLNSNTHDNNYLQNSFNKYNGQGFIFNVIELIEDKNLLIEREQFWIDFYQSYNPDIGYNLCRFAGSTLNRVFTEEHKRKLSIAALGKKSNAAKLTIDQVKEIRQLIIDNIDLNSIAKKYSVSQLTIKNIKDKKTWNMVS